MTELQHIFAFGMHLLKRRHQFPTRSNIICCFQSFAELFRELNDREIENHYKMNSENVETWHGIIISPHSMCERVERVTAKTGRTSCTNWTNSFGVSGFRTRTHLLHGHFIFLNLLELQPFLCSVRTIQSTSSIFNTFWHHFIFFSHLPICLES